MNATALGSMNFLDYDVIIAVMDVCDRSSVASLMRTCSTLYHKGAKRILKDTVIVRSRSISSFYRFMLAENGTRFRFLQSLQILAGPVPSDVARQLRIILPRMTHLHDLTLCRLEDLLRSDPKLVNSFARLQSVRHLDIKDAGELVYKMVRRMRSTLTSFRLDYGLDEDDMLSFLETLGGNESLRYHPVLLCGSFHSSLEELHIEYNSYMVNGLGGPWVYPKLWRFSLAEPCPYAQPYITQFPNVTHLSVKACQFEWLIVDDHILEFMQHREENIMEQMQFGTWQHLQEYDGGVLGLFLLGLTCHIPRLLFDTIERQHLQLLGPVFDAAKPVYLELNVCGDLFGQLEQDIPALLRLPGCASLADLTIHVEIGRESQSSNLLVSMNMLLGSLSVLPLESLKLTLVTRDNLDPTPKPTMHVERHPTEPEGMVIYYSPSPTPAPLLPVEQSLEQFDSSEYAQRVTIAVATLKEVVIDVHGPRKNKRPTVRWMKGENGVVHSANLAEAIRENVACLP